MLFTHVAYIAYITCSQLPSSYLCDNTKIGYVYPWVTSVYSFRPTHLWYVPDIWTSAIMNALVIDDDSHLNYLAAYGER